MKIQSKIIAIVSISIIIYSIIALLLQYNYLQPEFEKVSTNFAKKDMIKSFELLQSEMNHISILANDYAIWDQSYLFTSSHNPNYPTEHIPDNAMTNAGISLIAFFDNNNNLFYGKWRPESTKWETFNPSVYADYKDFFNNTNTNKTGFILLQNDIYLISIEPIVHSDGSGPANGKLIFGEKIGTAFASPLLKSMDLNINIHILDTANATFITGVANLFNKQSTLVNFDEKNQLKYVIHSVDDNKTNGYAFIKDVNGTEVFLLQTSTEKSITILGKKFSYFSAISIAVCGILIALLLIIFFREVIVKPLEQLSLMVSNFNLKESNSSMSDSQILTSRTDEIGQLAQNIQAMEDVVIEKHTEVLSLNEQLDAKVIERTAALEKANNSLLLSDTILNETSEGILITDTKMEIIRVNDSFLRMTRYKRHELLGNSPVLFKSDHHDSKYYQHMWMEVHSMSHWSGEFWAKRKDGTLYPTLLSINALKNERNLITHYVCLASDITHIKETEQTLEKLAYFDALTELPNRELFHDRLNQTIKRSLRNKTTSALLFIDLDRFKIINDTLGHATGDEVLIEVSKRLQTRIRESDTVSRLGGDEFTIILENIIHVDNAKAIADDLIDLICMPIATSERTVNVSASIGIAMVPTDDVTPDGLMRKADAAMYIAKENGRSQTCFSSKEIEQKNQESLETEARLREALKTNEFELYLQPKVQVKNRKYFTVGAEALIRWKSSEGHIISPDQFIGIAEETGLIHAIGKWVLEEACRISNKLTHYGYEVPISVNLSVKQLERFDLIDEIRLTLEAFQTPPSKIQFELTENLFLKDFQHARTLLENIKALGSEIAIDDFGKGYSSMSYIGNLPVDYLKIDKAFIDPLGQETEKELVSAIIAIAKTHHYKTIAEGVETEVQMNFLIAHDCDEMQGYLFAKPLPFAEFLSYLERTGE